MTAAEVIQLLLEAKDIYNDGWAFTLFCIIVIAIALEWSKLPVNPLSNLANSLDSYFNAERDRRSEMLVNEFITLKANLQKAKEDSETEIAKNYRTRILRVGNEIKRGELPDDEMLAEAYEDCEWYERYCNAHPNFINNKANANIAAIHDLYEKRLKGVVK